MPTTPFHGPDAPTTAQQMRQLHERLGIERVNVFKMKEPPADAHPKVLRAYWLFRTLPDMWRTQFDEVIGEELGLLGPRGMAFDDEQLDEYMRTMADPDALTYALLEVTNPTIDMALRNFAHRMRGVAPDTTGETAVMANAFRQAEAQTLPQVTDSRTLSMFGEQRWDVEAAGRQGFRAARDAEWRLQGVLPRVSVLGHGHLLQTPDAETLIDSIEGPLGALADSHEQVFLAIRRLLRGSADDVAKLPYDPDCFFIADRGDGRLTLEIKPEIFERVANNPPQIDDPWTGCPSIPFVRRYHAWSARVGKRFYVPQLPHIQHLLVAQRADALRDGEAPIDPGVTKEGISA